MRITNKHNLPEPVFQAIINDPYDKGEADYSATELINPIKQTILRKRHDDEIEEDALDRWWSLLGQCVHEIFGRAKADNSLQEERVFADIDGSVISGAADLYCDGVISDYKITSVWTAVYKSRLSDWEKQMNIYAYLFRNAGFPVKKLQVECMFRDFSEAKAMAGGDYPPTPFQTILLPLWDQTDAEDYIKGRVNSLKSEEDAEDGELPDCTSEEMWEKETTYAVMKDGRKSAVKVWLTELGAQMLLATLDEKHSIQTRPGKRVRCGRYCSVSKFCHQYIDYQSREETE